MVFVIDKELERLARDVVRQACHRLSVEDQEDVLQEVLLKYHRAFPEGRPDNPAAWIQRTTERTRIDLHRAGERRPSIASDEPDLADAVVRFHQLAVSTSYGAMAKEYVDRALAHLSAEEREVFESRYLDNLSAADVAQLLGISVDAVNTRASRARAKLKAAISAEDPVLEEMLREPHPRMY